MGEGELFPSEILEHEGGWESLPPVRIVVEAHGKRIVVDCKACIILTSDFVTVDGSEFTSSTRELTTGPKVLLQSLLNHIASEGLQAGRFVTRKEEDNDD